MKEYNQTFTTNIISIQYLRALAAGLVLLEHVGNKSRRTGNDILSWMHFGYTGVDIFFVISGFIMCFIYMKSPNGASALLNFWKRRILRILPMYWLVTLVALCVFLATPHLVNSSGGKTVVWQSFLLIPGEGQRFLVANGWTLSFEMYFYAIFSIAFLLSNKMIGALLTTSILLIATSAGIITQSTHSFPLNTLVAEFAFGIIIYKIHSSALPSSSLGHIFGITCLFLGALGIASQVAITTALPDMRFVTAGIPAALLTYGLIELEEYFHKNPIGWIQKLGDSSYSMYLLHPFPIAIAGVLLGKLNISDSPAARAMEWSLWIAVMIATLVTSHLAYLQIETRLNSKGTALVDWTICKFKEICNQRNTRNI